MNGNGRAREISIHTPLSSCVILAVNNLIRILENGLMNYLTRVWRRKNWLMLSVAFAFVFANEAVAQAQNQQAAFDIKYELSMPNPASHLFEVRMEIDTKGKESAIDVQMPRWSPGRYAVYDFAQNVQELKATNFCAPTEDCEVMSLPVSRIDNQTWRAATRGVQRVAVSYKVFANNLSGTFSQLDERHANYNGASVFAYVVNHKQDAVSLKINAPAGWKIANGRIERANQTDWRFDNYDILIDTPTEIAPDFTLDEFQEGGKTYRVMVHSFGDEGGKRARLVKDIQQVVRAETSMMGAPDFDSYTFLIHFAPKNESGGDGMEHLTSTQIIETGALGEDGVYEAALDTAAHEFFHVWNVKRIRPVELGPWDFTRPVNTRSLWIAEGLTNYYGTLFERRAGLRTEREMLDTFGRTINYIENAPGNRLISAEEASIVAPFMDRTPHQQNTNLRQSTVSYYIKGEVLGLVLDMTIRRKSGGKRSLDDVMRAMYDEFYLKSPKVTYYLRGRGYTGADFECKVTEAAGADMKDFFDRYVRGAEILPYDEALATVGLRLARGSATDEATGKTTTKYGIEEIPNAPDAALAERAKWLNRKRYTKWVND